MKKTRIFILMMIILCVGLCACSKEENGTTKTLERQENEQEKIESVSLEQLSIDTENLARKQLNSGKSTTVYGRVSSITAKDCCVESFITDELLFSIELPLEVLAKMEAGRFVIIDVILKDDQTSFSGTTYGATATEFIDSTGVEGQKILDQYVRDLISKTLAVENNALCEEDIIKEKTNADLIASYIIGRDKEFQLKSDEKIKNYLVGGVWEIEKGDAVFYGSVQFYADQTYNWHLYFDANPISSYWKDSKGDWSVENGEVDAIWPYAREIYVITDNLFYVIGRGFDGGYIQRF